MDDPAKRKYEPAERKEINHGRPSDRKEMKKNDLAERIETNGQPSRKKVRTSRKERYEQWMTKPKGKKRKMDT